MGHNPTLDNQHAVVILSGHVLLTKEEDTALWLEFSHFSSQIITSEMKSDNIKSRLQMAQQCNKTHICPILRHFLRIFGLFLRMHEVKKQRGMQYPKIATSFFGLFIFHHELELLTISVASVPIQRGMNKPMLFSQNLPMLMLKEGEGEGRVRERWEIRLSVKNLWQ